MNNEGIFHFGGGTAAAKMKDKVQPKVVKERAEILRKLGDELAFKFREQFIGENCEILLENTNTVSGRSERYFMVSLAAKPSDFRFPIADCQFKKNEIVKVKITAVTGEGAAGETETIGAES